MPIQKQPVADPWCLWPSCDPYAALELADIGPQSTLAEVRNGFFDLMARGLDDDLAKAGYNELQTVARRLINDVLMYDAGAAGDLLEWLEQAAVDLPGGPNSQALRLSWDV